MFAFLIFVLITTNLVCNSSSLRFTTKPRGVYTYNSYNARFDCEAEGATEYVWLKDGNIPTVSRWNPNGKTLIYKSVKFPKDDGALITCEATQGTTTIIASALLTVFYKANATHPIITKKPIDVVAGAGANVSFNCTSYGILGDIRWIFGGITVITLPDLRKITTIYNGLHNTSILTLYSVTSEQNGVYVCQAFGTEKANKGSDSSNATLTITHVPEVTEYPNQITYAIEGDPLHLECHFDGYPTPSVTWIDGSGRVVNEGSVWELLRVSNELEGEYRCFGNNTLGRVFTEIFTLVIHSRPVLYSNAQNITSIPVGGTFELFCNATGRPRPTIRWYKDNVLLNATNRIQINYDRLTIGNLIPSDNGPYTCLVQNSVDSTSSHVSYLKIITPPLKPTGLDVNDIQHNRVTLYWTPVEYDDPIIKFDLLILDVNNSNFYRYQSIPTDFLTRENNLFKYNLESLVPYTFYNILIQANNTNGASGFSQFPVFKTKTYFPSPPTISTRNITPFSVEIVLVVNKATLNGPLIGFNVTISSLQDDLSNTTAIFIPTHQLSFVHTQSDLIPFNRYLITAFSYNRDYYSNMPSSGNFTTAEYSPTSPPTNLHVNCTSPSICSLSWGVPIQSNGIITSYTLTLQIDNIRQSHVESISVRNELYLTENLKPYSRYSWEISASTIVGSGPSVVYGFDTPQGVPNNSPMLNVRTINSTTIDLNWPSLERDELNGVFHFYQIKYTFDGISGEDSITRKTEGNSLSLTNLTPYTNYGFTIRVNAGIGYGPYSPIPIHRITSVAPPEEVVENFTGISHSPTSILLQWTPVHRTLINAPNASYKIEIKSGVEWNTLQELMYTTNSYLVTDLLPYTLYIFRIQLLNERGSAPFSTETNTTTQQTIPGVPALTEIATKNPLQINISITPTNTSDITQYNITVNLFGNATVQLYSVPPLSMGDTTYFIYNATRYISLYVFKVFAANSLGGGESATLLVETGESIPSQPPSGLVVLPQSSTSIYLSWNEIPTQFLNGRLVGYLIRYRSSFQTDWTYLNSTPSEYKHVTDLEIFSTYSFQVAGVTIDAGEFSLTATMRTLPDRPSVVENMHVNRVESNLLEIEWDEPEHPNGIISIYRVQLIDVVTNSFTIYSVKETRFLINNLKPFTKYKIAIAARNQILTGKFSVRFNVTTSEDTPSKPYFSHVIQKSRQLKVFWHTPQDPNGIIIDYNLSCILQNSEISTKRFITVSHETDTFIYSATCDELFPNRIYKLELFARNSFDSNWNAMLTQTDYLPPILSNTTLSSPQSISGDNLFILPKFSETNGEISFYLLVVVIFDPITASVDDLTTNYSIAELKPFSSTFDSSQPHPYIAANLTPSEYGEFEIGDGEVYGGFENIEMVNGYGYSMYVLACVNSINENEYLATSSALSQPIILKKETPSNHSLAVIASIVASSMVFLCILTCLLFILITVFIVRVRSKKQNERNIPYKPCDMELTTVPWSANVNFKKIPKGSDPISYYRSVMNDPHLDARPPVPAYMLPKILENLLADNEKRLSEEYSHLTPIDTSTTDAATMNTNAKKNRYLNILPYDHNRVTLTKPDSDYINASFIDSADRKNCYIATQGPTEVTLEDFWQMVYDQHIQCLVMITKLKENSVEKCLQYWPTDGTNYFGKYKVTLNFTTHYCDYTIRELTLSKINSKESRILYHFQFVSWPDHRIPSHAMPMLNFIKRVHHTIQAKQISRNQPVLVHCSAGVGRTGTFIVLDSMMKRMLKGKEIDVFGHVSYLRTQRMFMVQGEDQYLFIFKVLTECFTSQSTSIYLSDLESIYSNLSMVIPDTQITGFDSEFLKLEIEYDEGSFTTATAPVNQQKNRNVHLIPFEISRVVLPIVNEEIGSDYINASFVDGYRHKQQFIATQTPLGDTITDFWRMIWHYNSNIIVMLNSAFNEYDHCYYPEKLQMYDKYQIEKTSERNNKDYVYQQFSMTNLNTGEARNISHFQHASSSEGNDLITAKALLLLCQEIGNMYQSLVPDGTGPITMHCLNGSGSTGMLIAVMNLLEEMRESETVNIFQTVHYLCLQRPYMVETVEQYQIVYEAILQQAKTLDFKGNMENSSGVKTSQSDEISPLTSPVKMSTFAKAGASNSFWNGLQNRHSYTSNYRSSQISAASAFSNPDEVLEMSD